MTILGIAGSLRAQSYNNAALRAVADLLPDGTVLDTFGLQGILIFNQDEELAAPPQVVELKRRIRFADAILTWWVGPGNFNKGNSKKTRKK